MILKKLKYAAMSGIAVLALGVGACSDYVQNVPPPLASLTDDSLNRPTDIRFLMRGVENLFVTSFAGYTTSSALLSDECVFDRDLFGDQTFDVLDQANRPGLPFPLLPNHPQVVGLYGSHARLRLHADTLIWRIRREDRPIQFETPEEESLRDSALFVGHFYAAAAFYMGGAYWAHTPTEFGATFDTSAVISPAELYQRAQARLDSARLYARGVQQKWVATFKARIALLQGNYSLALSEARDGLVRGDQPLRFRFFEFTTNPWFSVAGRGQARFVINQRYLQYLNSNFPGGSDDERVRLPMIDEPIRAGGNLKQQDKYPERVTPIDFLTWQENTLIWAEASYREFPDVIDVIDLVNDIRRDYRMTNVDEAYIDRFTGFVHNDFDSDPEKAQVLHFLYTERDKQMWLTGMRLLDQRRFNQWHLPINTTWQAFPISEAERELNPNGLQRYFN